MKNMVLKSFFLICLLYSCKEATELKIVRDNDFFTKALRNDKIINGKLYYDLHERYFVFGYHKNIHEFDSVLQVLICNKLKENDLLSRINFSFEDYGKYATYREGDNLSADFTNPLVSVLWEVDNPNILNTSWGRSFTKKIMPLDCSQHLK